MVCRWKKILLVIALTLMLIPVMGFQELRSLESAVARDETPDAAGSMITGGTSTDAEEDNGRPDEEAVPERDLQPADDETMEEQEPDPRVEIQNEKTAYLTFDDGPSPLVTPKILETLKQYDIQASFFVLGKMAEQNPELVRRIRAEGHLICNHSYSHNYKFLYSNPDNFMADVTKCGEVLKTILGQDFDTRILRFPAGSFGRKKQPFRERAKEQGYVYVDWNALNGDAEALHIPADKLVDRVRETTQNRNNAVVLMHDSNTKDTTAEALPEIIDYLKSQGYHFKTLEDYALQIGEDGL